MPVEPVRVVGHDHVGRDLLDDLGERGRRLLDVGLPEAARVVVVRQAHHPRVAVPALAAEEAVVRDAERRAGAVELDDPVLAELVGKQVAQVGRDDLTELAERAGHQRDPRALRGVLGHRGAGADRLVVRVRVHEQQAAFHPVSLRKPVVTRMSGFRGYRATLPWAAAAGVAWHDRGHDGELSQAAGADAPVHARGAPGVSGIAGRRAGHVPAVQGGRRPGYLPVGGRRRHRRRSGSSPTRGRSARTRRTCRRRSGPGASGSGKPPRGSWPTPPTAPPRWPSSRCPGRSTRCRSAARLGGWRRRPGWSRPRPRRSTRGPTRPGPRSPTCTRARCASSTWRPARTWWSRRRKASPSAWRSSSPPRRWTGPAATGGPPTAAAPHRAGRRVRRGPLAHRRPRQPGQGPRRGRLPRRGHRQRGRVAAHRHPPRGDAGRHRAHRADPARRHPPAGAQLAEVAGWDRAAFPYLVNAAWGDDLLLVVQTRDQKTMRIVNAVTGEVIREDTDPHWTDVVDGVPAQLASGDIVWTGISDDTRGLIIAPAAELADRRAASPRPACRSRPSSARTATTCCSPARPSPPRSASGATGPAGWPQVATAPGVHARRGRRRDDRGDQQDAGEQPRLTVRIARNGDGHRRTSPRSRSGRTCRTRRRSSSRPGRPASAPPCCSRPGTQPGTQAAGADGPLRRARHAARGEVGQHFPRLAVVRRAGIRGRRRGRPRHAGPRARLGPGDRRRLRHRRPRGPGHGAGRGGGEVRRPGHRTGSASAAGRSAGTCRRSRCCAAPTCSTPRSRARRPPTGGSTTPTTPSATWATPPRTPPPTR